MTQYKAKSIINYARIAVALTIAAAIMITGCKPTVTADSTPPAAVTKLTATAGDGKVSLSWTNPADADLYQVKVTASPAVGTLANAVYLAAAKGTTMSFTAERLANGTEYTFAVTTIDKSLNAGKVATAKAVPKSTGAGNAAGKPMKLTLTQSPKKETKTNGKVTVTVTSSTSIKEAKWMEEIHNANEIFASGTPLTGTHFTVSESGTYSVAVLDNDGRREVETINIENIDTIKPHAVHRLRATYSSVSTKITAVWQNPADSDFAGVVLSWKKGSGQETTVYLDNTKTDYEIASVPVDESEYTISIKAKDDVGNESDAETITVKATTTVEITSVTLDRTHLDTVQTDRDIQVTVYGSNFDKITSLKVWVKEDAGSAQPSVVAAIDTTASQHKATATVQAPKPDYPGSTGKSYTVIVLVDGRNMFEKKEMFKVSTPAEVYNISLSEDKMAFEDAQPVAVTVWGSNFDIRGETKVKLLDSDGAEVAASTVSVPENEGTDRNFTATIETLPIASGTYTVAVFFKGNKQRTTAQLQLYGAPEIASVTIPKAGTLYKASPLPVTIRGKNFTAPGVRADDFSGSGAAFTNFRIIDDTLVMAEVECPNAAGDIEVTVMRGTVSKTGTLSVVDSSIYAPGKIVLSDKTLAVDSYNMIDPSNPPVGVLCGYNLYKAPIMLGLHISDSFLAWAAEDTTGEKLSFQNIICTPDKRGRGAAEIAKFEGDTDGSDNWEYIKSKDHEGSADAAVNYPAFNWANMYNIRLTCIASKAMAG